jgi:hypothetical protein
MLRTRTEPSDGAGSGTSSSRAESGMPGETVIARIVPSSSGGAARAWNEGLTLQAEKSSGARNEHGALCVNAF